MAKERAKISSNEMDAALYSFLHWYGIPTFLSCPYRQNFEETDVGFIGFPYSGGNSIERMQYLAPRAVRCRSQAYHRSHREFGINPFELLRFSDLGDVPMGRGLVPDLAVQDQQQFFAKVHAKGITPIVVGGDHSITTPILRAIGGKNNQHKQPLGMIHFDAHTDTQTEMFGTKHHAGAAFLIGVEEGLIDPKRTVQIGLRGPMGSNQQDAWALDHLNVLYYHDIIEKGIDWTANSILKIIGDGPTYVSFDLDVLDLAYAPAVADPEVEGLTTREFFGILNKLRGINIVGADTVCYCPPLDNPAQTTALIICQYLLHIASHIADYRNR